MKKNSLIFATVFVAMALSACDDGDIKEQTYSGSSVGRVVKLTGKIKGIDSWNANYSVSLAGFGDSEYSIVQKNVMTSEDGETEQTLSITNNDVKTIELCVTNILRERILTLKSIDIPEGTDSIFFNVGEVDAGMYECIQSEIFTPTCVQCHGGSNSPAAGLYLTKEKSYAALVGQPSTRAEGEVLVVPGESKDSWLHKVINKGYDTGLHFSHENMLSSGSANKLQLIDEWIDNGAKH